ncbi:MAG: hypothetical protein IPH68_12725 [Chitinophagaceae bacterium]|nr:hypothetical protein [Chitinophagaceae bacterium]
MRIQHIYPFFVDGNYIVECINSNGGYAQVCKPVFYSILNKMLTGIFKQAFIVCIYPYVLVVIFGKGIGNTGRKLT